MFALSEYVMGIHFSFVGGKSLCVSFGPFYPFGQLGIRRVEFRDLEAPDCASALEFR